MSDLNGMDGGPYASADFGDADEQTPMGVFFDIGGNGQSAPYSLAVNNIVNKHVDEIKNKTAAILNTSISWKRRLRDFMSKKNNDLLEFLKVRVENHSTFGPGEILLRRFGNPQITPTHPSVRDMILDVSGESILDDINARLLDISGEGPLKDYAIQTQILFSLYKEAGDKALHAQQILKGNLERLDRIQGKIAGLFDIDQNEKYEPLMMANEEYLQKIYEDSAISEDYNNLIQAYRQFVTLRDIVTMARTVVSQESEPLCSICIDEPVAYTLSPCGHTFCQTCIRRQSGQCFMCRTTIKDKIKLYFS